jgi:biopolymer transport protein TolQ
MATQELDLFKIMLSSGIVVKTVLLLLLAASIYSWTLILKKSGQIKQWNQSNSEFLKIFFGQKNLTEVYSASRELTDCPIKVVFDEGYSELLKIKEACLEKGGKDILAQNLNSVGLESLNRSLIKGINVGMIRPSEKLSYLASIGSITPFIGLFGTVWGIIDAFKGLAGGGGSIDAVAPGIAEALVATAIGLAAAIPAVWFYNVLQNKVNAIQGQMESFSQDFLNFVQRTLGM